MLEYIMPMIFGLLGITVGNLTAAIAKPFNLGVLLNSLVGLVGGGLGVVIARQIFYSEPGYDTLIVFGGCILGAVLAVLGVGQVLNQRAK